MLYFHPIDLISLLGGEFMGYTWFKESKWGLHSFIILLCYKSWYSCTCAWKKNLILFGLP